MKRNEDKPIIFEGETFIFNNSMTRVCLDTKDHSLLKLIDGVDVKVPHTKITEVAGMVFVEVNMMMMLTTSVTATSRMFPMLANTAMT